MRPPTQEAMGAALQILLESIGAENGGQGHSSSGQVRVQVGSSELDAKALEAAVKAFGDYCAPIMTKRRRERNATVPRIHRLPNETIATIFGWTRHPKHIHQDSELLHTLAQVCHQWHSLVLSSPELWSRISAGYPSKTVELFLQKSGTVPLTVALTRPDITRFLALISPSSSRWRSTIWRGVLNTHSASVLSQMPPSVVDVDISQTSASSSPLVLCFAGTAPFKHVTLRDVEVDWSSSRFSQLSSLNLTAIVLDWNNTQTMIKASPALETLILHSVLGPSLHEEHTRTDITLSLLRTFSVQFASPLLASLLSKTLYVPNCRFLFIDRVPSDTLSDPSVPLLRSVIHFMAAAPQIILSVTGEITITSVMSRGAQSRSADEDAAGFHISFQRRPQDDLSDLVHASALVALSGSSSPVILEVGSPYHKYTTNSRKQVVPPAILSNLPRVRKIRIHEEFDAQALVDALATEEGYRQCPDLEALDHWPDVDMELFVKRRGGTDNAGIWRR